MDSKKVDAKWVVDDNIDLDLDDDDAPTGGINKIKVFDNTPLIVNSLLRTSPTKQGKKTDFNAGNMSSREQTMGKLAVMGDHCSELDEEGKPEIPNTTYKTATNSGNSVCTSLRNFIYGKGAIKEEEKKKEVKKIFKESKSFKINNKSAKKEETNKMTIR